MANIGRLEYKDSDNLTTRIEWTGPSIEDAIFDSYMKRVQAAKGEVVSSDCWIAGISGESTYREYCGTDDPLSVKWAGNRYSVTAPSSATIRLLIQDNEDRTFLEQIFNGGYTVIIVKEDATSGDLKWFWKGRLTESLGIEEYRQYPYQLNLNANDAIKYSEKMQFLMTDFPEPEQTFSVLALMVRYLNIISTTDVFYINVAARIRINIGETLDTILVDPKVFMDTDKDEYIPFDDVLESLLGPLHLQLIQWKAEWWIIALDAQWDKGSITYDRYRVTGKEYSSVSSGNINELGILDLYEQNKPSYVGDREVKENAHIDFIPSWSTVFIEQDFQINTNILPVAANRTGNFYHGHVPDGEVDFVPLEFNTDIIRDVPGNLRNWLDYGLTVNTYYNKYNAGYIWVNTVKSGYERDEVIAKKLINDNLRFDKFTFNLHSIPTYKNIPNTMEGEFTPKRNIVIKYTTKEGQLYYFHRNENEDNPFDGWHKFVSPDDYRRYVYDYADVNIEALMPDKESFYGGIFEVQILNSDDEHGYGSDYGMLYNQLQLGIVSTQFVDNFVWEDDEKDRKRRRMKQFMFVAGAFTGDIGMQIGIGTVTIAEQLLYDYNAKKYPQVGAATLQEKSKPIDFNWEDEIKIDINPKSRDDLKLSYRWGLMLPSIESFKEIHISSAYYGVNNTIVEYFRKDGVDQPTYRTLLDWKAQTFINENTDYTTVLSGTYKSDNISPLQLVNDFEGRVYKFTSGTWNDKQGFWGCSFTEFKALVNLPDRPAKCDYSPYDYNDDYCKEFASGAAKDYNERVITAGGIVTSLTCWNAGLGI